MSTADPSPPPAASASLSPGSFPPADQNAPPSAPALRDLASHLCFWSIAGLGLALDLWSKRWAFQTLGLGGRRVVIPRLLELQTMLNDGALFGIGSGQTTLFLIASALALGLVAWMFVHSPARSWLLHIALGAILAGALGNMYDRMFVRLVEQRTGGVPRYYVRSDEDEWIVLREYPVRADGPVLRRSRGTSDVPEPVGYVRDFLKIPTRLFGKREIWPWVFNVADTLLVGGVGILALRLWGERHTRQRRQRVAVDARSPAP